MTSKQRLIPILAFAVIIMGAGLWFAVNRQDQSHQSLIASGTVEATEAQLGFSVPGRIENIMVHEGEPVKTGVELAYLDRAETTARRQQAVAQVIAARAQLQELERGFRREEVAQGRSALAAAVERLNDARRDLERTQQLYEGGAVSQEAYDKARVAYDVAKSQHEQAQEQLKILETGPRQEKIEAQRAQLSQAEAAVRTIDAILANMVIRVPFDGFVTVRHRELGEIVSAGSPILTIMNPDDRWVRIYIPENRIGAVHLGQSAVITTDTYPTKVYQGKVIFIATEAEFTPKTVQTTEERVKLVYAVKVRVTEDPTYDLKPGMPADVRLEPGKP
jgi:HlyD family secretion protein